MTGASVCPYCRTPIIAAASNDLLCPSCDTPHHAECFEENGGCTVFGCGAAPPPEPKVSIGAPDLQNPDAAGERRINPSVVSAPPPPPPPRAPSATAQMPTVSAPLFTSTGYNFAGPVIHPLPYVPLTPVPPMHVRISKKNRTAFIVLGALLGPFGAHSLYAGSTKKCLIQLAITLLSFGFGGLMVWIWAIIDICTITTDNEGIPFRS